MSQTLIASLESMNRIIRGIFLPIYKVSKHGWRVTVRGEVTVTPEQNRGWNALKGREKNGQILWFVRLVT